MTKHLALAVSVVSCVVAVCGTASADETSSRALARPGSVTLPTTVVVGRQVKPSVTIELSRPRPEIKLSDLSEPAVEKVLRAAEKAPF